MTRPKSLRRVTVKEVLANGDQRCEVLWPAGTEGIDSPVKDWRQVRDVDFTIDSVTGEAILSFTRKNARKVRRQT